MNKLLMGAAIAGGLIWASKQEGGMSGVFHRFQDKVKDVQNSDDPMGTLKSSFKKNETTALDSEIKPASAYAELPEHTTAG